jgi:hypothetical protein
MYSKLDITAFIMGTAHPQRLEWLKQNLENLDSQNFPFVKKIVAIDQFNGHTVPLEFTNSLEERGWQVQLHTHKSRKMSTESVLNEINSEFIFYNEDDVLSNLPDINDLTKVFNTEINGRRCGIISMTLGGTKFNPEIMDGNHRFIGDLKFINQNIILKCQDYDFFLRLEEYRNDVFFEFPGMFVKTKIFKFSHDYAKESHGWIETALTNGYFYNKFDEKYYKSSVCKKNALDILIDDCTKVNSHCRLLTNLDPYQGHSHFGGIHFY